ncbi:hypothetical protein T4E_10971 [Trichinella pseudospiralis]|uniref:Uncharacterized protein n=1 Tax=Trichinella pseudospiralis TaxID=6337 RepID=A0A0V0XHW3_TRIPS|nr:hypothetical protein T4E_10971 [Trichinella pseudospiralis]
MQMTPYKISIDGTKQIKTKPRGIRSRTRRSGSRTTRSRSVE